MRGAHHGHRRRSSRGGGGGRKATAAGLHGLHGLGAVVASAGPTVSQGPSTAAVCAKGTGGGLSYSEITCGRLNARSWGGGLGIGVARAARRAGPRVGVACRESTARKWGWAAPVDRPWQSEDWRGGNGTSLLFPSNVHPGRGSQPGHTVACGARVPSKGRAGADALSPDVTS